MSPFAVLPGPLREPSGLPGHWRPRAGGCGWWGRRRSRTGAPAGRQPVRRMGLPQGFRFGIPGDSKDSLYRPWLDGCSGAFRAKAAETHFRPLVLILLIIMGAVQVFSICQESQTCDEGFDLARGTAIGRPEIFGSIGNIRRSAKSSMRSRHCSSSLSSPWITPAGRQRTTPRLVRSSCTRTRCRRTPCCLPAG